MKALETKEQRTQKSIEFILQDIHELYLNHSGNYNHQIDIYDIFENHYKDDFSIFQNFESLTIFLDDYQAFHSDIIYYSEAMDYLTEEDTSLNQSINIAIDFGYNITSIDSVFLANLLMGEKRQELWFSFQPKIEMILDKWNKAI
jgi:hypothetical protein